VSTVIDTQLRGHGDRHQRWERSRRAELFEQYHDLQARGLSQRQAANRLDVARTPLQAWRAWQDRLDACPQGVAFFESVPGLAFLHRLVLALHVVFVEVGACGIRLGCLLLPITGLNRFVGASYGTPQQVNRHVEEAIVAYKREDTSRMAQERPPPELQCGRASRVPGIEESPAARPRSPPKVGLSDHNTYLLPHMGGRYDRGGAIFRPETSRNVCCDLGIRRDTTSASQPIAASHRLDHKVIGWPTP